MNSLPTISRLSRPRLYLEKKLQNPCWKAYVALFIVYIVWGTTVGTISIGVKAIPPGIFVVARYWIAALVLGILCFLRRESLPTPQSFCRQALVGITLLLFGNALNYYALKHVPVGLTGIITASNPFFVTLLAISVFKPRETLTLKTFLGLLVGFLGMALILLPKILHPAHQDDLFLPSVSLILLSTFFWALGSITSKKLENRLSILMSVAIQNFSAGLVMLPVTLALGEWTTLLNTSPSREMPMAIGCLLYLALIGSVLTTSCYIYTLKHLPIALVSTFSYVTPLITLLFGVLVLHEEMTWLLLLGSAVILSGVAIVQWSTLPKKHGSS